MADRALCIGGSLDGKIVNIEPGYTDGYSLQHIRVDGAAVLCFYLAGDTTITAALHMLFAAYAKKGK